MFGVGVAQNAASGGAEHSEAGPSSEQQVLCVPNGKKFWFENLMNTRGIGNENRIYRTWYHGRIHV